MNTLIKRSFSIFCQKAFRPTHYLNFRTKFYNLSAKQQNTVINKGKPWLRTWINQYILLKELDELKRIPEFENAMSYALRQNYDLSKVYFLRLIEILNNQDSINPGIILLVLKKFFFLSIFFLLISFFSKVLNCAANFRKLWWIKWSFRTIILFQLRAFVI